MTAATEDPGVVSTGISRPVGDRYTVDDLDRLPDDGLRYELLDGMLVVSPAPILWHQEAVFSLAVLLRAACPRALHVLVAPVDWRPSRTTNLQPDVVVARRSDLLAVEGLKNLVAPPVLAVEVLSPSTRHLDRISKLAIYQGAGVPSYWLVDPSPTDPSLQVLELRDGHYVEVAHVHGDEEWTAERPFPVTVRPSALVEGLRD